MKCSPGFGAYKIKDTEWFLKYDVFFNKKGSSSFLFVPINVTISQHVHH